VSPQVVSDKVLIKRLQREVSRLEAELAVSANPRELQARDIRIQQVSTRHRLTSPQAAPMHDKALSSHGLLKIWLSPPILLAGPVYAFKTGAWSCPLPWLRAGRQC
jgi:hypothetical protein